MSGIKEIEKILKKHKIFLMEKFYGVNLNFKSFRDFIFFVPIGIYMLYMSALLNNAGQKKLQVMLS